MLIYTKIAELQAFLSQKRKQGLGIGFVPTMGALHLGHISLIEASREQCGVTICSIFVNPTQFNDKKDLERYPRTPERDIEMLREAGCSALFMPSVSEMYPNSDSPVFDFGHLDKVLEGKHRPGHFNGVAQVVKRFFEIVGPDKAFFGSKDYQQVMIVKALVKQISADVIIVPCPILREPDGLAMSSRNTLLSQEERRVAATIPQMMRQAKETALASSIGAAKEFVTVSVSRHPDMKLDYFEFCEPETLSLLPGSANPSGAIALIAVFVGKVRLIDNLFI